MNNPNFLDAFIVLSGLVIQVVMPFLFVAFVGNWSHDVFAKQKTTIKKHHIFLTFTIITIYCSIATYLVYFVLAPITGQLLYLTLLSMSLYPITWYGFLTHIHIPLYRRLQKGEVIISEGFTPPWKWKLDTSPTEEEIEEEKKRQEDLKKPIWKRKSVWTHIISIAIITFLIWEIWLK